MVIYQENDFRPFMPDVEKCSRSLLELNNQWESVKLLCEINCPEQAKSIMPNMAKIQNNFFSLQNELINALISESLNKMYQKAKSKAQAAVDILIRNLYERTADVGFLATDDDIRNFVCKSDRNEADLRYITGRLREYQEKYTVYEEIIILDNNFNVLANLDENNVILSENIQDPLLWETMNSNEFLETFRYSPLQRNKQKAHIFSKKVLNDSNEAVGILCLCFKFENEMKGIFSKLSTDYDGSVITIIDKDNKVIATSDANQVPVDINVEPVSKCKSYIVYYRGAEYIAKTVSTNGYQGYFGLGWMGHIMLPLNLAFKDKPAETLDSIDTGIMSSLMSQANSFSIRLHEIMEKTKKINFSLKRIIFNGELIANNGGQLEEYKRLKPILNSIKKTGTDICSVFESSVKNLFATVISGSLREVNFLAAHCIDIMDRNLYERADDCRWWALNPTFRSILSRVNINDEGKKTLTNILQYINSLYTVYTVIFIFDTTGKVVAVSNPEYKDSIGSVLTDSYVKNIINNNREEKYFVSSFERSTLYSDKHTYIYGATITDLNSSKRTVGGIGVVFDSEFQFKSMLEEAISSKENSFAVYTDRDGRVISSSDTSLETGHTLNLPKEFFEIKNGSANSIIFVYNSAYYAVGYSCSSGYREYKNSDGYKNDVFAFVFEKLADCISSDDINNAESFDNSFQKQSEITGSKRGRTYGTFFVEGHILALEKDVIVESVEDEKITCIPGDNHSVKGVIEYKGKFVTVLDMRSLCGFEPSTEDEFNLLIIKNNNNGLFMALMVDQLINVIEVCEENILPAPEICCSAPIKNVIFLSGDENKAILVIDEQKLVKNLAIDRTVEIDRIVGMLEQNSFSENSFRKR